jgi:hypothetical protein
MGFFIFVVLEISGFEPLRFRFFQRKPAGKCGKAVVYR